MMGKKGVSTIVGVMLMIVVTVLLAAAVSMYANSVSVKDRTPSAEFSAYASYSSGNIKLDMLSGDTIYKSNIKIRISTDYPETSGYVNMSNVTFIHGNNSNADILMPGDVMLIKFVKGRYGAEFTGQNIRLSIPVGYKFRVTIIDKDTGQPIWSSVLVMNP